MRLVRRAELKRAFAGREDVAWRLDEDNGRWLVCALEDLPADALGPKYTLEQDPDVLDTWFSSALWPHSTLGWPEPTPELAYYYPTSVLVTSRDIITLWVARMVMTGLYNVGNVPFHHVYIHPKILDGFGETHVEDEGQRHRSARHHRALRHRRPALQMVFLATETQDSQMPVANVCPHCGQLVPQKQEHLDMRTRKVTCPECKKPFRPGGPWPADDAELPTARQASERFETRPQLRQQAVERRPLPAAQPGGLHAGRRSAGRNCRIEDRWILSRLATTTAAVTRATGGLPLQRGGADDLRLHLVGVLRLVRGDEQGPAARPGGAAAGAARAGRACSTPSCGWCSRSCRSWPSRSGRRWTRRRSSAVCRRRSRPRKAWSSRPGRSSRQHGATRRWRRASAACRNWSRAVREVRNRYTWICERLSTCSCAAADDVADDFRTLTPFITLLAGVGRLECGPRLAKPRAGGQRMSRRSSRSTCRWPD